MESSSQFCTFLSDEIPCANQVMEFVVSKCMVSCTLCSAPSLCDVAALSVLTACSGSVMLCRADLNLGFLSLLAFWWFSWLMWRLTDCWDWQVKVEWKRCRNRQIPSMCSKLLCPHSLSNGITLGMMWAKLEQGWERTWNCWSQVLTQE